jgi:hypothetical protein
MAPYPINTDWHFVMLATDSMFWFTWAYTGPEWSCF